MNTWEMESITSVPNLLAAVAKLLPTAQTVSFEIQKACPEAEKVYAKHRSSEKFRPLRDTISPRTKLYYCVISKSLSDDLKEALRRHETKDVFWHIKGFDDRKLVFAIHDADFDFPVCFSGLIDAKVIRSIGSSIRRKPVKSQTGYDWNENHRR